MVKAEFPAEVDRFELIPEALEKLLGDVVHIKHEGKGYLTVSYLQPRTSLRSLQINPSREGYEISLQEPASAADYRLFKLAVMACIKFFNGIAIIDGSYRLDSYSDSEKFKWKEWADYRTAEEFGKLAERVKTYATAVEIDCGDVTLTVGPRMLHSYGDWPRLARRLTLLKRLYTTRNLILYEAPRGTLVNEDDHSQKTSVTIFDIDSREFSSSQNSSGFLAVLPPSHALLITNTDKSLLRVVRFDHAVSVIPGARRFDEESVIIDRPLSPKKIREMLENVKIYGEPNIFKDYTYPGRGFDESRRTYLLFWNIGVSPVKPEDFDYWMTCLRAEPSFWNIGNNGDIRIGDRWFLIARDADGVKGIVGSGIFDSNPWGAKSSPDSPVLFADLLPNSLVKLSGSDTISGAELRYRFPAIEWDTATSGTLLPTDAAMELEQLWAAKLLRWEYTDALASQVRIIR